MVTWFPEQSNPERSDRKGTNGVSANGVTAIFMFFDREKFWVLPLTYFYLPKSAREYLFAQSDKMHYFGSGPISVDRIHPQPIGGGWPVPGWQAGSAAASGPRQDDGFAGPREASAPGPARVAWPGSGFGVRSGWVRVCGGVGWGEVGCETPSLLE